MRSTTPSAGGPPGSDAAEDGPGTGAARTRVVLVGASGRMGRQIVRVLADFPLLLLTGAVASPHSDALGADAGVQASTAPMGVPISAALPPLLAAADLVIDFSAADAAAASLDACAQARVPLLIGTTGLAAELDELLAAASRTIALLVAANTSLGVALLLELVRRAARALPESYDIEIVEAHHRGKRDAPSGTALALGAAAAGARGVTLEAQACFARASRGAGRTAGEIGFACVRGGDVIGEHQVLFLGEGERLLLGHSATDRGVFARGALQAGQWLARQPPGRYGIDDFMFRNKLL